MVLHLVPRDQIDGDIWCLRTRLYGCRLVGSGGSLEIRRRGAWMFQAKKALNMMMRVFGCLLTLEKCLRPWTSTGEWRYQFCVWPSFYENRFRGWPHFQKNRFREWLCFHENRFHRCSFLVQRAICVSTPHETGRLSSVVIPQFTNVLIWAGISVAPSLYPVLDQHYNHSS